MSVYYNENDPFAAAWLRELIKAGLIANGEVDERSIADVRPYNLRGFVQCHFFAGIGGWSYALRLAGWPDDRAVWTGSCPCQPFSSAGAQAGGHDPRDLWPVWFELVKECRPRVVFGEQVEAAIGHGWLDRLCDDLEAEGYAVGACGLPAASVGAPHVRQRLFFVADASRERRQQDADGASRDEGANGGQPPGDHVVAGDGKSNLMAHSDDCRPLLGARDCEAAQGLDLASRDDVVGRGQTCGRVADSDSGNSHWGREPLEVGRNAIEGEVTRRGRKQRALWRVKPGLQLLAYGLPNRVGRLGGFGNAIVPQVAQVFIEAYMSLS